MQTHTKHDVAPLPAGRPTLVRVPIYPFGHAFRAGSQIRIVVQPPGGNRPAWAFDALTYDGTVTNQVARRAAQPSKVVLPVISGVVGDHSPARVRLAPRSAVPRLRRPSRTGPTSP